MDQVLRNLWVTSGDPDGVPAGVERVFVFDGGVDEPDQAAREADTAVDADWAGGTEVHWAGDADLGEYETFATVADDVLYSLKAGRAVLVVRRPDAALTTAVLGKRDNLTHPATVETLLDAHDPEPEQPDETLTGHVRRYVNE
jgi:hypothetical protein